VVHPTIARTASSAVTRRGEAPERGAVTAAERSDPIETQGKAIMRGILLWLLGIPIPILILLYLFNIL
jgi:hypothetical protein